VSDFYLTYYSYIMGRASYLWWHDDYVCCE